MSTSNTLAEQLLAQPQAPLILQRVQEKLEEERKRRQQFYLEVTEQQKIEYINGEVIVHSPVRKRHNKATSMLFKLIDTYVDKHDLGFVGIEKIMISLTRNDYDRSGEPP